MTLTVVVVDDQPLVRAGLAALLSLEPDLEVVGEAPDGVAGVDLCRTLRPDVVLMDVRMPVLDGVAATRRIVEERLPTRVLVLTTFDLDEHVYDALRAGAAGFLLKDADREELVRAVRVVAAGDAVLAPSATRRLIAEVARRPGRGPVGAALDALTSRERDVLLLVARGASNEEVAAQLHLGEATVRTHVSSVLAKLGVRNRVQAVVAAYEGGLVQPGS